MQGPEGKAKPTAQVEQLVAEAKMRASYSDLLVLVP